MGFLGGKKKNIKPDYTGLQLQTAVSTLPIPLLWGRQKMTGNLIWYNGFTAFQSSKKGKGGKSHALSGITGGGNTETDYRADIILALCEGPVNGIGFTWQNQSLYAYQYLMFNPFGGGQEQEVWAWLTWWYPSQQVAYSGTAYMAAAWYQMGSTPEIGNLSFEVLGNMTGTGANGTDADPALVVWDFLTNARYGAGFDPNSIDQTTLFGPGGDASLQTYCKSLGIAFSPLLNSQEAASSILARWLQLCSSSSLTATLRPTSATSRRSSATSRFPMSFRPTAAPHTICRRRSRSPRPNSSCPTAGWSTPRAASRSFTSASSSFRRRTSRSLPARTG